MGTPVVKQRNKVTMNKILICSITILLSTIVNAQSNKEVIRYYLFDKVEIKVDSIIRNLEKSKFRLRYYCLLTRDSDIYNLSICNYQDKDIKNIPQIVFLTNRYAVINKRLIPIIFDYDLSFTTPRKNYSLFGKRDGNIIRMSYTTEAPNIYFDSNGNIINQ